MWSAFEPQTDNKFHQYSYPTMDLRPQLLLLSFRKAPHFRRVARRKAERAADLEHHCEQRSAPAFRSISWLDYCSNGRATEPRGLCWHCSQPKALAPGKE